MFLHFSSESGWKSSFLFVRRVWVLFTVKYWWKALRAGELLVTVSNSIPSIYSSIKCRSFPSLFTSSLSVNSSLHSKTTAPWLNGGWINAQTLHQIASLRQITHESLLICIPLCPLCPSGWGARLGRLLSGSSTENWAKKIYLKKEVDLQGDRKEVTHWKLSVVKSQFEFVAVYKRGWVTLSIAGRMEVDVEGKRAR